jgi:hypothetical protein
MSLPSWNYTDISISGSIPTECAGGGSGGGGGATEPDPGAGVIFVDLSEDKSYDFEIGMSYEISKCGTATQNLKCDANGGGKELYVNNEKKWTSFDWQNLTGNFQSAGNQCVVGNIITVKNGMIRCVNGW